MTLTTQNNVNEIVQGIVSRFAPKRQPPLELTANTHLVNEAGIDSPRMIDVVLEIEDRFGLTIEDQEVQDLSTFGELVGLVQARAARTGE